MVTVLHLEIEVIDFAFSLKDAEKLQSRVPSRIFQKVLVNFASGRCLFFYRVFGISRVSPIIRKVKPGAKVGCPTAFFPVL
ncbi:conserved hypothetical protein, partial [delta proteobacterium NaphS2]